MTTIPSSAPGDLADPLTAAALTLIRRTGPLTRANLAEMTGWARTTVTSRVDQLRRTGLITPRHDRDGTRGRPAVRYGFNAEAACVLVADVGASGMRMARCDLAGTPREVVTSSGDVADGPAAVLARLRAAWHRLAPPPQARAATEPVVWGVAIGLPGPVEFLTGRVVDPPIMTGWNDFDVVGALTAWYDTPVHVENDVNAMAVGEATMDSGPSDLLVIKVGTGVGAGIISGGRVVRGAAGAAGDIGHTEAETGGLRSDRPLCRCGRTACLEAYCGGWALVRDARAAGHAIDTVDQFMSLLHDGDRSATRLVVDAGRILGSGIATAVSLVNPSRVVLGGQVGVAAAPLIAGVRERVYGQVLPLATRDLVVEQSRMGSESAVLGLAHEVVDRLLDPHRPTLG